MGRGLLKWKLGDVSFCEIMSLFENRMRKFIMNCGLASVLAGACMLPATAQLGIDASVGGPSFLTTVGTTQQVAADQWAYLLWQPTDEELAQQLVVAIYRKDGPSDSANPFVRVSVTQRQTDDRFIAGLVPRAVSLGQDVTALDASLTALFQAYVPDPAVSTATKIAAVMQGVQGKPEQQEAMAFLAQCQPLVALAMGRATADRLPGAGVFTYEIREFDSASGEDIRVLGRVTVDTAVGVVLPAPGAPVEVLRPDDKAAEGHLAIHLRWATPDVLRERSPMQAGYHVYRVTKAYAEDGVRKWQVTPPSAADLIAALNAAPNDTVRVSRVPVFPDELLTAVEAADATDRETYFVTDDNRRYEEAGTPLHNGDQFYYFVTALDVLCRSGAVSPGTLATACDRLPPVPPSGVRVTNEVTFGGAERIQRLAVRWPAAVDGDSGIQEYRVYRWSSLEEIQQFRNDPSPRQIGTVVHDGGTEEFMLVDQGAGAPRHPPAGADPDVAGTLFFYTVQAVDTSACGGNISAHSGPARGILRDAEGPASPSGEVLITCYDPAVTFLSFSNSSELGMAQNTFHFKLRCAAIAPRLYEWAEFRFGDDLTTAASYLGRVYFESEGVESQLASLLASSEQWPSSIWCRAALRNGRVSDWVVANVTPATKAGDVRFEINWAGTVTESVVAAGGGNGTDHCSIAPGSGDRVPTCVGVTPTAGAAELKIYRRVGDGPLTLVEVQELEDDSTPVVWKDMAVPMGVTEVCYFSQLMDEDGHSSAMTPMGPCVRVIGNTELPTPALLRPEAIIASGGARKMRVKWSCAPYGVERFELWIARKDDRPTAAYAGSGLSDELGVVRPMLHPDGSGRDFGIYQTALAAGLDATEDGTLFSADLPVISGETYYITIRAVGPGTFSDGRVGGDFSNFDRFIWNAQDEADPVNVPWPARELPVAHLATDFHPEIEALFLNSLASGVPAWHGVGIRIGEYEYRGDNSTITKGGNAGPTSAMPAYYLPGQRNPIDFVFEELTVNDIGVPRLMPLVLYRVQIPTTFRPVVSADTSQASPMMERIAHELSNVSGDPVTIIHDPFIAARPKSDAPAEGNNYELLLLDRNPVIKGASYQYLLVRFGPDFEIEEVLATNTVQIPES